MYSEQLAESVGEILADYTAFDAVSMFGGLAFMVKHNMCCGILKDSLILRLDKTQCKELVKKPFIRYFDFTGTPMKSIVVVDRQAFKKKTQLEKYVKIAASYVVTLPPKKKVKKRKSERR